MTESSRLVRMRVQYELVSGIRPSPERFETWGYLAGKHRPFLLGVSMKKFIALAMLVLVQTAMAEPFIPKDKTQHFIGSIPIGIVAADLLPEHPKWVQVGVATIPGLLKELQDRRNPANFFDVKDLLADAIGATVGVYGYHYYIVPNREGGVQVVYAIKFK